MNALYRNLLLHPMRLEDLFNGEWSYLLTSLASNL